LGGLRILLKSRNIQQLRQLVKDDRLSFFQQSNISGGLDAGFTIDPNIPEGSTYYLFKVVINNTGTVNIASILLNEPPPGVAQTTAIFLENRRTILVNGFTVFDVPMLRYPGNSGYLPGLIVTGGGVFGVGREWQISAYGFILPSEKLEQQEYNLNRL